jgi:hypothetical protein
MRPRSGDVLHLTREASVQFAAPILFRVIRVHDWDTYAGWVWLDGYQLDKRGDAVARRDVFVQVAGLRPAAEPVATRPHNTRNGGSKQGSPRASARAGRGR